MSKPTPPEVTSRLLIMKYVVVQALSVPPQDLLNDLSAQWSKDEQRKFTDGLKDRAKQLVASMKANNLWNSTTKEEQEFIQSIPPKIKLQQHINAVASRICCCAHVGIG